MRNVQETEIIRISLENQNIAHILLFGASSYFLCLKVPDHFLISFLNGNHFLKNILHIREGSNIYYYNLTFKSIF